MFCPYKLTSALRLQESELNKSMKNIRLTSISELMSLKRAGVPLCHCIPVFFDNHWLGSIY